MNIIADATGNNFAYHGLLELKEVRTPQNSIVCNETKTPFLLNFM